MNLLPAPEVDTRAYAWVKAARDKSARKPPAYSLAGRLYLSQSGWLLLDVPNALVRGAFQALEAPGAELPPGHGDQPFNAHVSVMRPEEIAQIPGGADAITERGKYFRYRLGRVRVVKPHGWKEMSRCWILAVTSPDLLAMRRSYGLPSLPLPEGAEKPIPLHCTIAVRRKSVLGENEVSKAGAVRPGMGIPDRRNYGDTGKLQPGQLLDFVIQHHLAQRAGEHYDVRMGNPELGLYSWATRKGLPEAKRRHAFFQQPLHSHAYGNFQGRLRGYGAGEVRQHRKGQVLVTSASPTKIEFTTADERHPQRYVLFRPQGEGFREKDWLIANTTPTEAAPYNKVHYVKVPREEVEGRLAQIQQGDTVQEKIDGASSLIRLLKDGVEVVSYRAAAGTGQPILHTERVFGGKGRYTQPLPEELVGTVLKGELYGERRPADATRDRLPAGPRGGLLAGIGGPAGAAGGDPAERVFGTDRVVGPQELGGLLNSTLARSLAAQRERNIRLRNALFDVQRLGDMDLDYNEVPYAKRREILEKVLPFLPEGTFHLPREARTAAEAQKLWQEIASGQNPRTREGIVIHPATGKPQKAKTTEEQDVVIREVFPGKGKYQGTHAGGFRYSLAPDGEVLGEVGTGLSDELRQDLWANQQHYLGRTARVRSQGPFASGALRGPSLVALHEDIPQAKAAMSAAELSAARQATNTEPSEAQIEAGNYKKGRVRWQSFEIALENPKGSTRSGTDKSGKAWSCRMAHDYGYFLGITGRDKDKLDVFIGPHLDSELVHVVNQVDPATGKLDEHKVVIGATSEDEARRVYLANYEKNWKGLDSIRAMTVQGFKDWTAGGKVTKAAETQYCTLCKEPWSQCLGRHGSKPCPCGSGKPRNKCDCPGGTPDKEAAVKLAYRVSEFSDFVCPKCKGHVLTGDPKTGSKFRGGAKCIDCGHEFSAVHWAAQGLKKRTDEEKDWPHIPTVAVDFDGTIVEKTPKFEPDLSKLKVRPKMKKWLKAFDEAGYRIVVFTVRDDKHLDFWLWEHDIPHHCINDSPEQPPNSSGKVYADVYWDDLAVAAAGDLDKSGPEVQKRLEKASALREYMADLKTRDPEFHRAAAKLLESFFLPAQLDKILAREGQQAACDRFHADLKRELGQDKQASLLDPNTITGRALRAQWYNRTWTPDRGLLGNLSDNLHGAYARGQKMIADQQSAENAQHFFNPGAANQWLRDVLGGRRSLLQPDPLDRLLFQHTF